MVQRTEPGTVAEGDRFMPLGLVASLSGLWGLGPCPLASSQPFPAAAAGFSAPLGPASLCTEAKLVPEIGRASCRERV